MWCPEDIGRDVWEWDEHDTVEKKDPHVQWEQLRAARNAHLLIMVIVVVVDDVAVGVAVAVAVLCASSFAL